jgi:alanyl-tRNA synthetase
MELHTGLTDGTIVSFAGGGVRQSARVLFAAEAGAAHIAVTDQSPFHPQSLTWPDQPGDRGHITLADGRRVAVLDSREAWVNRATGVLSLDDSARALKRGDPDLAAVVVHVVDASLARGDDVTLEVDQPFRDALSLQHTGVHLAALALNRAAQPFWTKDGANPDSLGAPDFDKAAVVQSEIGVQRSTDVYRLGKSLRKKGFDAAAFLADLPARAEAINETLRHLLADAAPVVVSPPQGPLGDRRIWATRLNGVDVSMPCGGTHVADLAMLAAITVTLTPVDEGLVMVTQSHGAAS